jgi:hypothetical protein
MTGANAAEVPVAQQWFRFSTLDERTTLIEEPHVDELLSANAWHLRGRDCDLLIDCGLGITALTPMLRERFDREPVRRVGARTAPVRAQTAVPGARQGAHFRAGQQVHRAVPPLADAVGRRQ